MNKRFHELVEKYKANSLNEKEFKEFLLMLNDSQNLNVLDIMLEEAWHEESADKVPLGSGTSKTVSKSKYWGSYKGTKWKVAASFIILISVSMVYFFQFPDDTAYTTYQTDFAEILDVDLPDGSKVTLNANSKLQWSNQWRRDESRQVIIDGEAFFKIKNLPDNKAFRVETGLISVEVVGTSFNVDNRNKKVAIYLDEGEVNLYMDHDSTTTLTMLPGQKVNYNARSKKIEKISNGSMISSASWKMGILNFKDMEFQEVLEKLHHIYGKSFKCKERDLLSKIIYLGVPYSDWEAVKQALELSLDIQFTESGSVVEIRSN